jgi:cytochrome c-type biogenesis protein
MTTYLLGFLAGVLTIINPCVGRFVATIGFGIGLDAELFQYIAGSILIALGLVLLSTPLQQRLALAGGGLGSMADGWMQKVTPEGWQGQLVIGLLLGVVWVPCVGPTLGAASIMASRGENLGQVALTMALFGIGAALPLLILGSLSRELLLRWRGKIAASGRGVKMVFGAVVLIVGISIITGFERDVQTWLIALTPEWLLNLATRY